MIFLWTAIKNWMKTKPVFYPLILAKQFSIFLKGYIEIKIKDYKENNKFRKRVHTSLRIAKKIKPYIVIISPSDGKNCGIAEYARFCKISLENFNVPCQIVTTSEEALKIAKKVYSVKSIIIQHEYAFFTYIETDMNKECFKTFTKNISDIKLARPEIKISMLVHMVYPAYLKKNQDLITQIADLLTTTRKGADFLRCKFMPLGAYQQLIKTLSKSDSGLVIGNFGFTEGYRDIEIQLNLCKEVGAKYLGSHYCLDNESSESLKELIYNSKVPISGLWTDYCDNDTLIKRLSLADIFYMVRTDKELFFASASVLFCMQLRRPIIVNPSSCYDDLEDTLLFANTLEEAIEHVERLKNPKEYNAAVNRIEEYLNKRQVAKVWKEHGIY